MKSSTAAHPARAPGTSQSTSGTLRSICLCGVFHRCVCGVVCTECDAKVDLLQHEIMCRCAWYGFVHGTAAHTNPSRPPLVSYALHMFTTPPNHKTPTCSFPSTPIQSLGDREGSRVLAAAGSLAAKPPSGYLYRVEADGFKLSQLCMGVCERESGERTGSSAMY